MRNYFTIAPFALGTLLPGTVLAAAPPPVKATITASSVNTTDEGTDAADRAFDGDLDTSWAEGKASAGKKEWIEIAWDKPQVITSVSLWPGSFKAMDHWESHNRLAKATLIITTAAGDVSKTVEIGDRFGRKDVKLDGAAGVTKVRLIIVDVHSGTIYDDTHIAEIAFNFPNIRPDVQAALDTWKADVKKYPPLEKAYVDARTAAFDKAKAGQDFAASFQWLGDALSRGAPFLVAKVKEVCPPGFRMQHIPVDDEVIEALRKLKNIGAVPYLERAAARSGGETAEYLYNLVKQFKAYDELQKAMREGVPNYGKTGVAKGAMAGRGESIGIDIDSRGDLYIADIGNNRVQRFAPNGTFDTAWGKDVPVITESWFGQTGDPYASGASPGKGPGEFEQPCDLAVGNYDNVAVIDASKRVQILNGEGKQLATWTIPSEYIVLPNKGTSTPIVTWWGDNFYFLLGKEVWGYKNTGEKVVQFVVEDDILAGVVADGKLLVRTAKNRDILEYAIQDGFRQGRFNKKPIEEDGSEDWDMATDENDNVYLLTDTGTLIKWDKKGKLLHQANVSSQPLAHPRMAVSGDVVYVVTNDRIGKLENPLAGK